MSRLGTQISNYQNNGNAAICLTNDLYKVDLENDEVFTYLRNLRNRYKVVLYNNKFMSKLPKIKTGINARVKYSISPLHIISKIMNVTSTTTNQDLTSTTTDQDLVTIQTYWFIV